MADNIAMQIEALIRSALNVEHLEIINESHKHAGHAGDDGSGQTHFKLMIVSNSLVEYNRMQRHKLILDLLKPLFSKGLHAVSIVVKTPEKRTLDN